MRNHGESYYDEYFKSLVVANYCDKDRMALIGIKEEPDDEITITVNLPIEGLIAPPYCSFINVNHFPDVCEYLEKNGIAKPVRMSGSEMSDDGEIVTADTDFVRYPMYKFDKAKLQEMGAICILKYERLYYEAISEKFPQISPDEVRARIKNMAESVFPDSKADLSFSDIESSKEICERNYSKETIAKFNEQIMDLAAELALKYEKSGKNGLYKHVMDSVALEEDIDVVELMRSMATADKTYERRKNMPRRNKSGVSEEDDVACDIKESAIEDGKGFGG